MTSRSLLALLIMTGVGCGAFGGNGDTEVAPAPLPDAGALVDASAAADAPAADDAADAAPPCTQVVYMATIEADTGLSSSDCAGANYLGRMVNMNVSSQFTSLVRFTFPQDVEDAIADSRVKAMTLTLDGNATVDGTDALKHAPGTFSVHPMRMDWDEGQSPYVSYSGADSCRRLATGSGAGWGGAATASGSSRIAAGTDYAIAAAGSVTTVAADDKLVFSIDPAAALFPIRAPRKISLLVKIAAGSPGVFFAAQRESTKRAAPELAITICTK